MYTILLFLLLLTNGCMTMFAMSDTDEELSAFIVHEVANGVFDTESGKKRIEVMLAKVDANRKLFVHNTVCAIAKENLDTKLTTELIKHMFAIVDPDKEFPVHTIVHGVAKRGLDAKLAKNIKKLLEKGQDLNREENQRTAPQLSAHYCANSAVYFKDQLYVLESLLECCSPEDREKNKKNIRADLDEEEKRFAVSQGRLDKALFSSGKRVSGGGFCVGDEEPVRSKKDRIRCVRELLEQLKN